jgi:PIN domain nuclease of toxin-antitoxin system
MESLKELMLLRELGEVASYLTVDYVCSRLDELNMIIEPVKLEHVYYMGYLSPVTDEHGHPLGDFVDRILVSQSISKRYTLVSGDHFFSLYSDQGLEVLNGRTAERTKGQEVNRSDPAIFPPEYLPKLSPGWLVRLSR